MSSNVEAKAEAASARKPSWISPKPGRAGQWGENKAFSEQRSSKGTWRMRVSSQIQRSCEEISQRESGFLPGSGTSVRPQERSDGWSEPQMSQENVTARSQQMDVHARGIHGPLCQDLYHREWNPLVLPDCCWHTEVFDYSEYWHLLGLHQF